MKSLNDYTQDATTNLFNNMGAFFAFSDKQVDEQKQPDIKYVSLGAGLICPETNAKTLLERLKTITKEGIALDIKENGKERIIERELNNHEAFYTGDIEDTAQALNGYGFTADDIMAVYRAELPNQNL